MSFIQKILSWFETEPAQGPHAAPLIPDSILVGLMPAPSPSLETQRYSDANYAVSRAQEARKQHVMNRVCAINNAAAEDIVDRKGTIVRPPAKPWAVIPMTEQELDDAIHLAEVTYVMEKNRDSRI